MGVTSNLSSVVLCSAVLVVAGEAVLLIYRLVGNAKKKAKKSTEIQLFHKVLFFPDKTAPCRRHLLTPKVSRL